MKRLELGNHAENLWVDVVSPSQQDLEILCQEFEIDYSILIAALDPEFLPKYEPLKHGEFLILRSYDEDCAKDADTTQELTRKLLIFVSSNRLLTIHRSELNYVVKTREKWASRTMNKGALSKIAFDLCQGVLETFDKPLDAAINQLEHFEMSIFEATGAKPFELKEGYLLRRRAFVFKRLVRLMIDIAAKVHFMLEATSPQKKKFREDADSLFYYCDELTESTNSLLSLHLSLATQKATESANQTNEVMRVLTVLSMFLLPLNVITGIYGMNFVNMPELKWPHGYYFSLSLMLTAVVVVYTWFRYKGWLKHS